MDIMKNKKLIMGALLFTLAGFSAAAATAVGFFSFLPTDYVGVAELGLIAGIGMVVVTVTLPLLR